MAKEKSPIIRRIRRTGTALAAGALAVSPLAFTEGNNAPEQTVSYSVQQEKETPAVAAAAPVKSSIWAGYYTNIENASQNNASIGAAWKVPQAKECGTKIHTQSAIWVGLGGTENKTAELEQIGTTVDCELGKPQYRGVYQMVNRPRWGSAKKLTENTYPVKAGDQMRAAVSYYKSTDANGKTVANYDLILRNETRNWYFRSPQKGTTKMSAHNTAEWIVEAPIVTNDKVIELTNFNKVTLFDCSANGKSISSLPHREIDLSKPKSDNKHKALPSNLRDGGKKFVVTWNK